MKRHTKYIISYEDAISDGHIDDIMKACDSIRYKRIPKDEKNSKRNNYAHYFALWRTTDPYVKYIEDRIRNFSGRALEQYMEDCPDIKFHLMPECDLLDNFVYRFYDTGGHYDWHVDKSHTNIQLKISILIFLNDDFEGGELAFVNDRIKIRPKKGSVIFFPCGPWFLHSSTPITEGNKHVIWNCYGQRAASPDKKYF